MSEKPVTPEESAMLLVEGAKALAKRRGVSLRTLRRQFVAQGKTLAEFVHSRRTALAVNLLQEEEVSFGRAGQTLGFSNQSSFARFVKREFGQSPRQLRANLKSVQGQKESDRPSESRERGAASAQRKYAVGKIYIAGGTRGSTQDPLEVLVREGAKGLARHEGTSLRTLRRQFKISGMTLLEARLTRQASMVVNLLQQTDATLRDVALQLGYAGVPSLTKFVRREFGVTPGKLRRQLQEH
jgi:AraC-like DNA-binding protein